MPAPSVVISEQNVGVRPVTAPLLNKIGLVGQFNHGPVGVATLVQSLAELKQQFGPTYEAGLTGMLSGHAIYAQNARAGVWVSRIAPSGSAAVKATQTFSSKVAITAKYPGTGSNDITVTIANGTTSGKKYTITSALLGITEVWDNVSNTDSTHNTFANVLGPNEPGKGSALVVFSYVADGDPTNAAAALISAGTPGTNGTPAVADYVGSVDGSGNRTGLYAFDVVDDIHYLLCAQQVSSTVTSGMQTYVASRKVGDGLVVGIVNHASGTAPGSVSIGSLDSMRLGMFWPWVKSSAVPTLEQANWIAPDGFVAGLLSTLAPNQSPINKQLLGITDLQYSASDAQVDTVSGLRINAITTQRGRGIRVRDGLTLSSDPAWTFWEMRAEYDALEMAAWDATQWVVGEPNIPDELWPVVAAQMDALLALFVGQGTIVAFLPTVVDDTNNTAQDIAAGRLNIDLRVQFTVDARFITIRIDRVLDASS